MRSGRSRRASGSPPVIRSFSTPCAAKRPANRVDLLEGQHLVARQEREVAPEDLLRHAVGAAEVAPVGDRDPQVVDAPPEPVDSGRRSSGASRASTGAWYRRDANPPVSAPECVRRPAWPPDRPVPRSGDSSHRSPGDGPHRGRGGSAPTGTPVPPGPTAGTTSALHRTSSRSYDANTPGDRVQGSTEGTERYGSDRNTDRLPAPVELGGKGERPAADEPQDADRPADVEPTETRAPRRLPAQRLRPRATPDARSAKSEPVAEPPSARRQTLAA